MKRTKRMQMQAAAVRDRVMRRRFSAEGRLIQARSRFYLGLLIFVVLVGIPIVGISGLRLRLHQRVQYLHQALGPVSVPPVTAFVGENRHPFPSQFEHQVMRRNTAVLGGPVVFRSREETVRETVGGASNIFSSSAETAKQVDAGPEYRQGKIESEAYELVLQHRKSIAELVGGSNPALRFKGWAAAKMEEDTYWVNLTFVQDPGSSEVHYIWRVRLASKEVTPHNYYARSLSSP